MPTTTNGWVIVATVALTVAASGCATGSSDATVRGSGGEGAQLRCQAMEAALDSVVRRSARQRLVLRDSTESSFPPADAIAAAVRGVPGLDSTTWRDFRTVNAVRRPTCSVLPSGAPMTLMSDSVWNSLPADLPARYAAFYLAYPGASGFVAVSGIGLSADRRQALLLVSRYCGPLCGTGYIVLLERAAAGGWRVVHARGLWIS